jgi:hypothetical protein
VIGEGGRIEWLVDTWRVAPAGLQVTRSIGDDDLKPAVTAEPEISETILSADDEFLVNCILLSCHIYATLIVY